VHLHHHSMQLIYHLKGKSFFYSTNLS
jgi:hypothetical protein